MAFLVKNWQNGPAGGTRLNNDALRDLETRLSGYTDEMVGTLAAIYIPDTLIDAKGDLIVGGADNLPAILPRGAQGALLSVAADGSLVWVAAPVGLQAPAIADYATAALATNAGESGVIAMFKGYRIRRIVTDRAARVRLYSSQAKRDADALRPLATDPPDYPAPGATPDHGVMFEAVTNAAHLDLPVAPNVSGAELTGANNVPIRVDNLDVLGVVNVHIHYQRIEP